MSIANAPPLTTYLEPELVENLQVRLNRIEGHVRGVNRMLEDQDDCDDIVVQLSAIKAALNPVTIKATGDIEALEHFRRSMALVMKNS
ncbi:MAG: metal-sensitive transcriptional regulator [Anaerolineales bacterium]